MADRTSDAKMVLDYSGNSLTVTGNAASNRTFAVEAGRLFLQPWHRLSFDGADARNPEALRSSN